MDSTVNVAAGLVGAGLAEDLGLHLGHGARQILGGAGPRRRELVDDALPHCRALDVGRLHLGRRAGSTGGRERATRETALRGLTAKSEAPLVGRLRLISGSRRILRLDE